MKRRALLLALASAHAVAFARNTLGQSFEVFGRFNNDQGQPSGRLLEHPAGVFYGGTMAGGPLGRGSIFRLKVDPTITEEEVHPFSWVEGGSVDQGLSVGPDSYLYGVTEIGGPLGYGAIFRIDPSGRLTNVHEFNGVDGAVPNGDLVVAGDGRLWGTTQSGGTGQSGTIFAVDHEGNYQVIYSFDVAAGMRPLAGLTKGSDGFLYGSTATTNLGSNPSSTIFRVDLFGNVVTLHSLTMDDGTITSPLAELDGYLYGGTYYGGSQLFGTVFRMDLAGGFQKLYDLSEGSDIRSALTPAPDGNLWGVTSQGGADGRGLIFRITTTGEWTTVHSFAVNEGGFPRSPLTVGADGNLYGACAVQGPRNGPLGTIFRVSTAGTFELLWTFVNRDGYFPEAGLVEGSDGKLYGTTDSGGAHDQGTLFRLSLNGEFEFLHDFGDDGINPFSPILHASDGNLYGTASGDGFSTYGFAYRYSPNDGFSILHTFSVTEPFMVLSRLVEANDGNLYGSSPRGGTQDRGTVFRLGFDGGYSLVHDFQATDGSSPNNLIQAADGKLYLTAAAPLGNQDSIFRLDLDGSNLELIRSLTGADGVAPTGLMQATSGDFFGTAFYGGSPSYGTIFRMDGAHLITVPHSFSGSDGSGPDGGVIQANDGRLYGTTLRDGASVYGTLFRMTTSGAFTTLWNFDGTDGAYGKGPLVQASDGNIYGVAGTVFRWLLSPATPTISSVAPTSGPASGRTAIEVRGHHFQTAPTIAIGTPKAPSSLGVDERAVLAITPVLTPGTLYDVAVTNPDATSAKLGNAWFADFLDVDSINPFHDFVEAIVRAGISAGCGGGNYCGMAPVTRAQMAVLLLKAEHGSSFVPPSCAGLFTDVACPGGFAADWIEELFNEGITGGCGAGTYCPNAAVRRDQMAVFLLKASLGSSYVPPPATGTVFADVPGSAFAADWIEDLYARNVTGGCLTNPLRYCPTNTNNRQQMAVFIAKTFGLQ